MKWFNYIVLSLLANVFLLSIIKADAQMIKPIATSIEINIMALAKPKTKPVVKQVKVEKKVIEKPKLKKIVVKKQAKKKITIIKKVDKKKPKKKPKKQPQKEIKVEKNLNSNKGKQVSTVLHKAKYKLQTPIVYPKRAIKRRQQGKVILKVLIDEFGKPSKIEIKKSSGFSLLDGAAIKTVKTWEFEPYKQGGLSVESWAEVPVKFEIKQ